FEKGDAIKRHAVAGDAAAALAQHSAGHQLQHKFFAVDDHGVAGVVSAGVARHYGEVLREHVDNFAFAFVAPLRAYHNRGLGLAHKWSMRSKISISHTAAQDLLTLLPAWKISGVTGRCGQAV